MRCPTGTVGMRPEGHAPVKGLDNDDLVLAVEQVEC
jgi:hypothetical protein